jgi:hypothetical protein
MQGKKILEDGSIEGGKTKVPVDFNFSSAVSDQLKLAKYNINQVKKYLMELLIMKNFLALN